MAQLQAIFTVRSEMSLKVEEFGRDWKRASKSNTVPVLSLADMLVASNEVFGVLSLLKEKVLLSEEDSL